MSVKKKTKRDYTSMKSVGVKNIDETFKVISLETELQGEKIQSSDQYSYLHGLFNLYKLKAVLIMSNGIV